MGLRTAVLGASGYAGGELIRIIDDHPSFEVAHLGAHSKAGVDLASVHPNLTGGDRRLLPNEEVPDVDLAFLALPHGASWEIGDALAQRGIKVVDLGSDYRLDTDARYRFAYGSPHPLPDRLTDWVYGLPELFRDAVATANLVASPGCYPTSALLALAPLLSAGLIRPEGIVVDSLSGVTGAGRKATEGLMFTAVDQSVAAYAIGSHRHRPEIEMALTQATGTSPSVSFTPHLVPMQRGLLSTCSAPLSDGVDLADLQAALDGAYRDEPFVDAIDRAPQTRWVVGSNRALVHGAIDVHAGRAIVVAVLDNLVKGAAGQAVQAANLMFGLDETAGLAMTGWMP
jgi:N-acetyl-gamma-glutamyl-phosphate reductase